MLVRPLSFHLLVLISEIVADKHASSVTNQEVGRGGAQVLDDEDTCSAMGASESGGLGKRSLGNACGVEMGLGIVTVCVVDEGLVFADRARTGNAHSRTPPVALNTSE